MNEAAREHDAKLVAAFGPGIVEAKRDFEAKRPFRHATEQLAQRLFYTDTPLAQTQAEALIDAMANQARRPGGGFDIRAMNFEAALTQAQGVLSPPQAAVWRAVEEERRRQQELEQRMLAERSSREREAPKPAR